METTLPYWFLREESCLCLGDEKSEWNSPVLNV
jgi:hypothetical protein